MLNSIRNFGKTIWAKILLVIIIVPFVTWGMGDVFRGGNTNTVAKVNKLKISTQNFIDHVNSLNLSSDIIKENINNSIIEQILFDLINNTLLSMEAKKLNIELSNVSLAEIIKKDENFFNDNKQFSRTKYEKFLITNNMNPATYEANLKNYETKRKLLEYISGGVVTPNFLIKSTFEHQNKKVLLQALELSAIYKKKEISEEKIKKFIDNNNESLEESFISFRFAEISPQSLINSTEFNELFFKKIDEIENLIINGSGYTEITKQYDLKFETAKLINKDNINKNGILIKNIEKNLVSKILELKYDNIGNINLIEYENKYFLLITDEVENSVPSLNSKKFKEKVINEITKKNVFEYNQRLMAKIKTNLFNESDLIKMANSNEIEIKNISINTIKDNNFFNIDANNHIFKLPLNGFAIVIGGEKNQTFLIRVKKIIKSDINENSDTYEKYKYETLKGLKDNIYISFDSYLNKKYKVEINYQTLERLKNYFR